ncbi:MAG: zinc-binding dehydrogenase [Terriglobales bacterium]
MGPRSELRELLPFLANGELRPVVDRTFPLAEAAAAQRHLEAKEQFGKVVLTVD